MMQLQLMAPASVFAVQHILDASDPAATARAYIVARKGGVQLLVSVLTMYFFMATV
jgi:hypothetical protein